jgi:hypothetical protein
MIPLVPEATRVAPLTQPLASVSNPWKKDDPAASASALKAVMDNAMVNVRIDDLYVCRKFLLVTIEGSLIRTEWEVVLWIDPVQARHTSTPAGLKIRRLLERGSGR